MITKPRIFISFDFDNDENLRNLLVGQSKHSESPFEIADWSLKEHLAGDWKEQIRTRIRKCHQVIVICGEHMDSASGVNVEIEIAQEEDKPYFLLKGRSEKTCKKPRTARPTDKIYSWTWKNLKALINGVR